MRYNLVVTYSPSDDCLRDVDWMIEKIVGRTAGGSGYGFGGRDLSFWFVQKPALVKAMKRLNRKSLKKYKVGYEVWDTTIDSLKPITDSLA